MHPVPLGAQGAALGFALSCMLAGWVLGVKDKANSSCCPYAFQVEISILGVIYGVLLWADMNAATPLGAPCNVPERHHRCYLYLFQKMAQNLGNFQMQASMICESVT